MALTLILGISAELPATLPFACGSDGGRSTRVGICSRIGRGWKFGVASRSASNGDRSYRLRAVLCLEEGSCRVSASGSGTLRGVAGWHRGVIGRGWREIINGSIIPANSGISHPGIRRGTAGYAGGIVDVR